MCALVLADFGTLEFRELDDPTAAFAHVLDPSAATTLISGVAGLDDAPAACRRHAAGGQIAGAARSSEVRA